MSVLPANPKSEIRNPKWTTIAVVGNPNTGKTTVFNALTGLRQHTANYPGVTVEQKIGRLRLPGPKECACRAGCAAATGRGRRRHRRRFGRGGGAEQPRRIELVDLPGAYSLAARSPDEIVVADTLLGQQRGARSPDAVLMVIDSTNLERNLFLASQVLECGRAAVVALNMSDLAEGKGIHIDAGALAASLGCPVVPVVASRGRGLDQLRAALLEAVAAEAHPDGRTGAAARAGLDGPVRMPAPVESAVEALQEFFARRPERLGRPVHRVEAMRVLIDRGGYAEQRMVRLFGEDLARRLTELRGSLAAAGIDRVSVEPETRYGWIERVTAGCVRRHGAAARRSLADRVDAWLTQPVLGTVIFVAVMAAMFEALFAGAGPLMDLIGQGFAGLGAAVGRALPPGAVRSLIQDGLIAGVGAVLVFLPQIVILFGFVAFLEDCGYMARAAFLMDRLLARVGLSGRSFVPMLSSFACAVPGVMATRVIENRRDRLATILICPLMSCSARLPIYVLLISAFIPNRTWLGGAVGLQGLTLLAVYLLGLGLAPLVAWLLKRTVLRGDTPPFVMEMPGFKWPSPKVAVLRMLDRGWAFVARAGTVIVAVAVIVWALTFYPHPPAVAERFERQRSAARANLSGPPLEAELARLDNEQAGEFVRQSFLGRAGRVIEPAVRPLGWDWKIGMAVLASFPAREVVISALGTIYNLGSGADERSAELRQVLRAQRRPDGSAVFTPPVAVGLMVFFLLCCQCAATLAVIRRETASWRWPAFAFVYLTALAYLAALAVYQGGRALGWA